MLKHDSKCIPMDVRMWICGLSGCLFDICIRLFSSIHVYVDICVVCVSLFICMYLFSFIHVSFHMYTSLFIYTCLCRHMCRMCVSFHMYTSLLTFSINAYADGCGYVDMWFIHAFFSYVHVSLDIVVISVTVDVWSLTK